MSAPLSRCQTGSSPLARGTQAGALGELPHVRFIPARAGNTRPSRPPPRGTPVHPRSRGEHPSTGVSHRASAGSSPLARGTPVQPDVAGGRVRFIPARAGNTGSSSAAPRSPPVHPRSRGEHAAPEGAGRSSAGSSPLARGTPADQSGRGVCGRFIPARAGNTRRRLAAHVPIPVHPRSRGEHLKQFLVAVEVNGSSPLARGTRAPQPTAHRHLRFIPARAGNTSSAASSASTSPVHPRSRGEHTAAHEIAHLVDGSSPLARGTPDRAGDGRGRDRFIRFIPARAGNTPAPRLEPCPSSVHPRSRGEHVPAIASALLAIGSSPLARGTRNAVQQRHRVERFIPARAGNTPRGSAPACSASVHPRSRGEHPNATHSALMYRGSSPLARGTRQGLR